SLLFLKTHLKDQRLRLSRDLRGPDVRLGDRWEWETLHHIHCVARSPYSTCDLDPKIHGSIFFAPAADEAFDYYDLYHGRTIRLPPAWTCLVAFLNESSVALNIFRKMLKRIAGPLSPMQLREVAAHLAYINWKLEPRPQYFSEFDGMTNRRRMSAILPESLK